MIRCLSILIIIVSFLIVSDATAEDDCDVLINVGSIETCSKGVLTYHNATLTVRGHLTPKIYHLLILIMANDTIPLERIELDSMGGDINERNALDTNIYHVAEMIRKKQITTVVPSDALCASACTLLFQSGASRLLNDNGQLVYHGVRILNSYYYYHYLRKCMENVNSPGCQAFSDSWYQDCATATRAFFTTLEQYGSSPTLFQDMVALPDAKDAIKDYNCFRKPDLQIGVKLAISYRIATAVEQSQ